MKLVVFGATGRTGQQIVSQALEAGHEVTAVARHPEAITFRHKELEVLQGDVLASSTLAGAIAGKDAVISAIGVESRGPTTLYSAGVSNMMQTMKAAHVRRIICVSATGLDPGPILQHWFAKPILWRVLKGMYTDLARMETLVKQSNLEWTIVRPPALTKGPRTGRYYTAVNKHLYRGWFISRADLAHFILTQLDNPQAYCAQIEVAH